ncbi:hypothetical protein EC991_004458 [Linnemannia zychae]|nr:hypothetical protein EC991_004458 [Linnemannia zychae]
MANTNLDEFYNAEGTSEEEWQRVYDLRYCTILVPFESDPHGNSGHSKEKHDSLAPQTAQVKQEPEELEKGDIPGPRRPPSTDSTPTPQNEEMDSDDQDHEMMTDNHSALTEDDPLTRYLMADTHSRVSREISPKNPDMDISSDDDEAETEYFHDATTGLEADDTVEALNIRVQEVSGSREHRFQWSAQATVLFTKPFTITIYLADTTSGVEY